VIKAFLVAAVLLVQAAPVAAQTDAPYPAAAVPSPPPATASKNVGGVTVTGKKVSPGAPDPKEIVCHREPVLGSLFPKEVCARREDIAERRRLDQATTRETQALRPYSCRDSGGC
jgi:hypothetical protein